MGETSPDRPDDEIEDETEDETEGETAGDGDIDDRSLSEIVDDDTQYLYERALDQGDVMTFDEDPEAAAHAVCEVENGLGDRGWVVISARGSSWEGLRYDTSGVFDTEDKARECQESRYAEDEEEYNKRMDEEEEEEDEEEEEG